MTQNSCSKRYFDKLVKEQPFQQKSNVSYDPTTIESRYSRMGEVSFTWPIPEYLDPISIRIFNNPKEMFVAVSTKNC